MEWGANPRAAGTVSVRPYRSALWARGRKSVTVGSHGKADVDAEGFYLRDRESGDLHIFEKRSLTAKGERSARIKTDAPVSLRWEAGAFFIYSELTANRRAHGGNSSPSKGEESA